MTKKFFHTAGAVAAVFTLSACQPAYMSEKSNPATAPVRNIVQVATDNGSFNTLVAAVKAAGLAETLQGPGPFTVFAPTDAAFAKLPAGTIDALIANKPLLASILTYHVVSGKVGASDIIGMNGATPATVNGQKVNVTVSGGKVYVNGVQVIMADVPASNGVIHVIDAVLMPRPMTGSTTR